MRKSYQSHKEAKKNFKKKFETDFFIKIKITQKLVSSAFNPALESSRNVLFHFSRSLFLGRVKLQGVDNMRHAKCIRGITDLACTKIKIKKIILLLHANCRMRSTEAHTQQHTLRYNFAYLAVPLDLIANSRSERGRK